MCSVSVDGINSRIDLVGGWMSGGEVLTANYGAAAQ